MSNKNKATQKWIITIGNGACGTGAGGLQFANGKAECFDGRIANWYENRGYTVTVETPKTDIPPKQDNKNTTPLANKQPEPPKNPDETKKESV